MIPLLPAAGRPTAQQSWLLLGLMAASFLTTQVGVGILAGVTVARTGGTSPFAPGPAGIPLSLIVLGVVVSCLSFLGPALVAAWQWRLNPVETFALRGVCWPVYPCVLLGMIGYTILVSATLNVVHHAVPSFDVKALTDLGQAARAEGVGEFLGIFLLLVALPGTYEELVFRGFLQRGFESAYPPVLAVLLSSFFFGLVHFDLLQGLGAMLLGLYLGFVVYRTGSIVPAISAHWMQNGFFMMANQVPGEHGLKDLDEQAPAWALAMALMVAVTMIACVCRLCPPPRPARPMPALVELTPFPPECNAASAEEV